MKVKKAWGSSRVSTSDEEGQPTETIEGKSHLPSKVTRGIEEFELASLERTRQGRALLNFKDEIPYKVGRM